MRIIMEAAKFRGSMLGTLLGDCCGAPFEGEAAVDSGARLVLKNYFDKLEGPFFKAPQKPYTDDTAMAKSVAKTLIDHRCIDQTDLAKNFVQEYSKNPHRGYGGAVAGVFQKLSKNKFTDVLTPASEQFEGSGSFGNGGAMRIAPVALFCYNKTDAQLIDLVTKATVITHTNDQGIHGAILQAFAIKTAFNHSPTSDENRIDEEKFLNCLLEKMDLVEQYEKGLVSGDPQPYCTQLKHICKLLKKQPSDETIINVLGNDISALHSVPTAIYCFLRALKNDIPKLDCANELRRTIEYAISLGGDTDTIACMAGSIAGAYFGDEKIPANIMKHCESHDEIIQMANDLYQASLVVSDSSAVKL